MFKKSLAALAVLGAAAGYASAADVTLLGVFDTCLIYTHQTFGDAEPAHVNKFAMESGVSSASRFGLKGTEELGNGLKVGFMLENGFQSDSGALKSEKRIFDREASVSVYSDFGTLSMGRMGGVGSGAGTYDLVLATADAFDGGDNNVFGFATSDRYDNMVTYQTPKFAGLQATVQYSFNEDSVEETAREGSSAVNRYSSAALTGDFGALQTVLAYEFQNYDSVGDYGREEDGHIVYLGGNYDCGFAKTFLMGQYFKGIKLSSVTGLGMLDDDFGGDLGDFETLLDVADVAFNEGAKGYGLHIGTIVPISNGDLTVGAYYVDGTAETSYVTDVDFDFDYIGLATKYEYRLSKRTSVYVGAGYHKAKFEVLSSELPAMEQKVGEVFTGLTHAF